MEDVVDNDLKFNPSGSVDYQISLKLLEINALTNLHQLEIMKINRVEIKSRPDFHCETNY